MEPARDMLATASQEAFPEYSVNVRVHDTLTYRRAPLTRALF